MGKTHLRGIMLLDIEVANLEAAIRFQNTLGDIAKGLTKPNLIDGVKITQSQHEVPLKTRRGKSGSVSNVIVRGTRKPNKKGKNIKGNTLFRVYGRSSA
jgi:hypothetical protein